MACNAARVGAVLAVVVALCSFPEAAAAWGPGPTRLDGPPGGPRVQGRYGGPTGRPPPSAEPWLRVHAFITSWGFRTVVAIAITGMLLAMVYAYSRQHAPYPPDRSPLQRVGCFALLAAFLGAPLLGIVGGARYGVAWFTWALLLGVIAYSLINQVSRRCSMCGSPLAFGRDVSPRHPDRCINCELVTSLGPVRPGAAAAGRQPGWTAASSAYAPQQPAYAPRPTYAPMSGRAAAPATDRLSEALHALGQAGHWTLPTGPPAGQPGPPATVLPSPRPRVIPQAAPVAAGSAFVGKTCPYCQTEIDPGEVIVVCPKCGMPHHAECWQENGGCTVYGCELEPSG